MDLGLAGRGALVAAASEGLGKAVASTLAREGCRIALCSRSKERLSAAAREIRGESGADVFETVADLTLAEDIDRWIEDASGRLGRLDILVTNAGGPPSGETGELDDEAWESAFHLTLLSVIRLCRAAVPRMRRARWGRIVNLASVSVRQPLERMALSNTLRAGVAGFSKTLAGEVAQEGVTVNVVCPGRVETARLHQLAQSQARLSGVNTEEILRAWVQEIPLRRLGHAQEIGDLVTFLCSDRAGYVTGAVIAADGGFSKGLL